MAIVETDKLLTPENAAEIMGLSRRRVQKLCSTGRLGIKIGRGYFITREQAKKFRANPPGRPPQSEKPRKKR